MEERATGTSSTQNKSTWKGKRPGRPVTHPRSPQLYQSWGRGNGWKPHLQKAPHYHSQESPLNLALQNTLIPLVLCWAVPQPERKGTPILIPK